MGRYRMLRWSLSSLFALQLLCMGGCATGPDPRSGTESVADRLPLRSADYVVVIAESSDTYQSLAGSYLGNPKLAYQVAEFNGGAPIAAGKMVAIPLRQVNPGGLSRDGYQTVPILSYEGFSNKRSSNKTSISRKEFEAQMGYLKENGYHVISLHELFDFIEYRRRPPARSVVITMDDGSVTQKTIALPILRKYGFTATLFISTDKIRNGEDRVFLSWQDLREFLVDGFDIETHGVSHRDLTRLSEEQILHELSESRRLIKEKLGVTADIVAYPYGVFNGKVLKSLTDAGFRGAVTVIRGGNPFFTNAFSVNRSMIYNTDTLEDFKRSLEIHRGE